MHVLVVFGNGGAFYFKILFQELDLLAVVGSVHVTFFFAFLARKKTKGISFSVFKMLK